MADNVGVALQFVIGAQNAFGARADPLLEIRIDLHQRLARLIEFAHVADDEQRCGDGERHDHPDAERDERGQRRGGLAHIVGLARANAFGDALHLVDLGANGVHRDLAAVGGRHHGRRIGVAGAQSLEIPANQSELGLAQSKELVDQRRVDLRP